MNTNTVPKGVSSSRAKGLTEQLINRGINPTATMIEEISEIINKTKGVSQVRAVEIYLEQNPQIQQGVDPGEELNAALEEGIIDLNAIMTDDDRRASEQIAETRVNAILYRADILTDQRLMERIGTRNVNGNTFTNRLVQRLGNITVEDMGKSASPPSSTGYTRFLKPSQPNRLALPPTGTVNILDLAGQPTPNSSSDEEE